MDKSNQDPKRFSNNEVAALIEDLKGEFRAVAEGVTSLQDDMGEVKERLINLEADVRTIKDVVQVGIPNLNKRVTAIEAKAR